MVIGHLLQATIKAVSLQYANLSHLPTQTLEEWLSPGSTKRVLLLDCREPSEFSVSHLPNAHWINPQASVEELTDFVNRSSDLSGDSNIVCYCSVGYRSCQIAKKLEISMAKTEPEAKKAPVYNLEGSIFKWAEERRPLVDNSENSVKFVHPYNSFWGKLISSELRKSDLSTTDQSLAQ